MSEQESWLSDDKQEVNVELKPTWDYKEGMKFVTVLPDTTRDFAMLTGDLDPTITWKSPIGVWTHEFKVASGKFATVICNKWNEACPFCFENEIYKLQNPDYKAHGGRLPKGLSKKALLQVWDFELKQVLFLLAGKQIQDGMNFILQKFAGQYQGIVSITRIGKSLSTNYRVDLSYAELTPKIKQVIKAKIMNLDMARDQILLSHQEIKEKTGISPPEFFQMMLPKYPQVDISGWGAVPYVGEGGFDHTEGIYPADEWETDEIFDEQEDFSEEEEEEIKEELVKKTSQKKKTTQQKKKSDPPIQQGKKKSAPVQKKLKPQIEKILKSKCTVGVYKGKTLREVIVQTGKSYIQYLARSGSPNEKKACQILLKDWDNIYDVVCDIPF